MAYVPFTVITDFVGIYAMSKNKFDNEKIELYIPQIETIVLRELLGDELYNEFIADTDALGVPQTQKFIDLLNGGVTYDFKPICDPFGGDTVLRNYDGWREMLKGFVYYFFVRDNQADNTPAGTTGNMNLNSRQLTQLAINDDIHVRYNKAAQLYRRSIDFINTKNDEDDTTYPNFHFEPKENIYISGV